MGTYGGGGLAHLGTGTHKRTRMHSQRYTTHSGCQNFSPPSHRCHNSHISITAQKLPTGMLIDLSYEVYKITINMYHSM